MALSMITDQVHPDLETALSIIAKEGYTHVEFHNVFGHSIEQCTDQEIDIITDALKKNGLQVSNIASTVFFYARCTKPIPFPYSMTPFIPSAGISIPISNIWKEPARLPGNWTVLVSVSFHSGGRITENRPMEHPRILHRFSSI